MNITKFKGVVPRMDRRDRDPSFATYAHNVNLAKGSLHGWGAPLLVHSGRPLTASFYLYGCCYFTWQGCVTATEWLPTSQRLYITGRSPYPEVLLADTNCAPSYYRLGVPAPLTAPRVLGGNIPSPSAEARDYVYTYVNLFDEEGGPSYPSAVITVEDGAVVTVGNLASPPPEYGIKKIRIYRAATGQRTAAEKLENVTGRYLVGEVPVGTTVFMDTRSGTTLGAGMYTEYTKPPIKELRQILVVEGLAILTGFYQNKVYFSENREPHNWPLEYEITLDDNIVSMCCIDGSLYVATTGHAYVITADIPKPTAYRGVVKYDMPTPALSCSVRNIVATPFGAVFVGHEGLVLLPKQGQAKLLTQDLWTTYQWQSMHPESFILGYYAGQLFLSNTDTTYILPLDIDSYKLNTAYITTASLRPQQMQCTSSGQLIYLEAGQIYQWDAGAWMPYTWRTSVANGISSITAIRTLLRDMGCVDVTINNDLRTVTRTLCHSKPHRFPRIGRAESFEITVTGVAEVVRLGYDTSMAESVWEVKNDQ